MTIVIPAYNPDHHLKEVLSDIKKELNVPVIVVNDGSSKDSDKIFEYASKYATVLVHEVNKGKGAAMKTAASYVLENMDEDGIIFVDADGQHKISDVKKMIDKFNSNKNALILGCRVFGNDVPFKSKMGNLITRGVFKLFTATSVSDTQTGLRAISTKYIPFLLSVEGERYEYEMNMLLDAVKKSIKMVEVPIETVYEDKKNSTSHFKVFRDSYLIYKGFLKFIFASFICFLIDYFLFIWFFKLLNNNVPTFVFLANIMARLISGTFNYNINKRFVFKSKKSNKSILEYSLLALFIILMNSLILSVFITNLGINPNLAKVLVEVILFVISFIVQQKIIFKE